MPAVSAAPGARSTRAPTAYAYPTPAGFGQAQIEPDEAVWVEQMAEWLLPYEAVRTSGDPAASLMRFLQSSFRAAADLAHWDPALECGVGEPGHPRPVASR